eukprot:Hpha_TRINITY_DN11117_c0_g1::TRINITY_DN11117_c0_g1_i1::g.27892::m.27892
MLARGSVGERSMAGFEGAAAWGYPPAAPPGDNARHWAGAPPQGRVPLMPDGYPPAAPVSGGGAPDTASSFLRDARSQLFGAPAGGKGQDLSAQGGGGWQAQLRQHLDRAREQPGVQLPPGGPFVGGGGYGGGGGGGHQRQQFDGFGQPPGGDEAETVVGADSTRLTEDEYQACCAVEFGAGIAMSGVTIAGVLRDGDEMPRLEPLANSVCLRVTPTAIIFLHQYDRNFILEVPITELYEITEDSDHKVVLLHTRNAFGSALIQLSCQSQRKRIGIYKTLCIRKNALERLKRQQQQISRAFYTQQPQQ